MKPWREIAVPHSDVLNGTFQQAEFAADLNAVNNGDAPIVYQDAASFFQRTFITEGMRLLLTSVARRLNGQSGDPVIQLQTAFGGGKTHTMLAVYHLAKHTCPVKELAGIPALLDNARLMGIPTARVAVLDGNALAPGQSWKHGAQVVKTLWGELAWQIGAEEAFSLLKEADANGTSPGKDVLRNLLSKYAPCVILMDELVAYIRQFEDGKTLSGGTYDSNLSFVQALTEAVKQVPNAVLLASLPESEVEAGSQKGVATLRALEKSFGRIQALWKPVAAEEAFEIVRRRLFEPIQDIHGRDAVCRAFANAYISEGAKMPSETQESRYFDRLVQAYPIHPEVFARLYEDWTTLEGFQRTRGVLKLMAKVIFKLWKDNNADFMIMPGSLPLYDGSTRNELTYYLNQGWDAVLEKDIDGDNAETSELETREPRLGAVNAARRVARTIFFGSAPASVSLKASTKGVDRARIIIGCYQPGQTASIYVDALNRLADKLHYLNASGDRNLDSTRYWFDTRANLRREMEDRKQRFKNDIEVKRKIEEVLNKLTRGIRSFDGAHVFVPHSDVMDNEELHLVFLTPDKYYVKSEPRIAFEAVLEYVASNGSKPRYRGNRMIFVAADQLSLERLRDSVRTTLAWESIVQAIDDKHLNIDRLQEDQAKKSLATAEEVLPRVASECYRWLLCPVMYQATDKQPSVEAVAMNPSAKSYPDEIERVCTENEWVITVWSPIHLRTKLNELYWKSDKPAVKAVSFWEDSLRYLYLPRLRDRNVLRDTLVQGASSRDFFGTALAQTDKGFEGFKFGDSFIQLDDTLLLIEPSVAKQYEESLRANIQQPKPIDPISPQPSGVTTGGDKNVTKPTPVIGPSPQRKQKSFHGSVEITPSTAKLELSQISDEIIKLLISDPNASVQVNLEISADFPEGVSDQIKRAVSENATNLGFLNKEWE
jgi:predicted AAA+ superfamily ATPase